MSEEEKERIANPPPPPREATTKSHSGNEYMRGMWSLFNYLFAGGVVSTQSQAARRWIEEQEKHHP